MQSRHLVCAVLASALVGGSTFRASAETVVPKDESTDASANLGEAQMPADYTRVRDVGGTKGFIFHPSTPDANRFRIAIGGLYDAVDPAVMYGLEVRVPQFTTDARYGLGAGWSLKGHFNSMFVTNELLIGGALAGRAGPWSFEGAASVGAYFGKLAQFSFDAAMVAAQYRPEFAVGYDLGKVALSVRGSVLLMGPERARVGDIWAGLDNSNFFVGHSEMIYVENPTASAGVWYFGLGAMTTRAYYQFWVLFPDSPALFTYARTVAGYEF